MSMDDLRYYYQLLYPYETIYNWLSYNGTLTFAHRELSFEYENESVQRYVKFQSAVDMKKRMTSNDDDPPRKVDAGAIWTGPPSKENKEFKPMQREFIFDFDMNDYDDVRTCCQGKKCCSDCWKFMVIAKEIITKTLEEDFGFTKFMYVYSGGRGMHIWVCDEEARTMHDSLRKSIVDYLEVVTGNDKASTLLADNTLPFTPFKVINKADPKDKKAIKSEMEKLLHPHIVRSLNIIKKWYLAVFRTQNSLTTEKCREVIFRILENKSKKLKERVAERWRRCNQSVETLWEELIDEIKHYEKTTTDEEYPLQNHEIENRKYAKITFLEEEILLSFLYPRMDYNVSTMQNHLLKLPFSVHPSSKRVSVPMFSETIEGFNPETCVNLEGLMNEIRELQRDNKLSESNTIQNAHKTNLTEYLRAMEEFCNNL